MINYNVFQYNREIEVVCVDGDNTETMTTYLGNMPMYDGHHKLHKGIDNTLRFKIKDTDQISLGISYKHAFNFNNFFIAPGVFFDYSNLNAKEINAQINTMFGEKKRFNKE